MTESRRRLKRVEKAIDALNLAVALLCQGDVNAAVTGFIAGFRRSPFQLTLDEPFDVSQGGPLDQIFDLSKGVAPDIPPIPYPAVAEQLRRI
jgi:hypothetical protein